MCYLRLPAGHQRGPPSDRGAESRHLDAPGVHPRHGGKHWCQLCRHLQGQRPVPVSVLAVATGFAFSFAYCLCLCLLPVPSALPTACACVFAYCLCFQLCLLPVPLALPTACVFAYGLFPLKHICLVAARRLCLQLCCSDRVLCISGCVVQPIRQASS